MVKRAYTTDCALIQDRWQSASDEVAVEFVVADVTGRIVYPDAAPAEPLWRYCAHGADRRNQCKVVEYVLPRYAL